MKKLLLATLALAALTGTVNAASLPVKFAAQAMIEDKVFIRCTEHGDVMLCTMVGDRLVMLRDEAFTSSQYEAPGIQRSHQVGGYTIHTCMLAKYKSK